MLFILIVDRSIITKRKKFNNSQVNDFSSQPLNNFKKRLAIRCEDSGVTIEWPAGKKLGAKIQMIQALKINLN